MKSVSALPIHPGGSRPPQTEATTILTQGERVVVPDCFACGTCVDACPTGSVTLSIGRRKRLPEPWDEFREHARARALDSREPRGSSPGLFR
ncbi:MAG: 4Fe-4S binding protein [Deltaproteobacteria bacterium]|nr:4Fe-4S binding protein [Deltaproteobacteria bacterium]